MHFEISLLYFFIRDKHLKKIAYEFFKSLSSTPPPQKKIENKINVLKLKLNKF